MAKDDYEYRGLVAKSWDFLRGDTSKFPDRQFYRGIIERSGEPVLVAGCGTGRLLLEYRRNGLDAEGLDVSPEMLKILRQKAMQQSLEVTTYVSAMESLSVPRKYRTIIVPSSSYQLVTDPTQAKSALDRFYKHLVPGGTLVMSIWHISDEGDGEWGDWWLVAEVEGFEDGKSIKRWERSMYDPITQLRHTESRYELIKDDEIVYTESHRRSPEMRDYTIGQLRKMFAKAGYSGIQATSGFSLEPASEEDEVYCMVGRKS